MKTDKFLTKFVGFGGDGEILCVGIFSNIASVAEKTALLETLAVHKT